MGNLFECVILSCVRKIVVRHWMWCLSWIVLLYTLTLDFSSSASRYLILAHCNSFESQLVCRFHCFASETRRQGDGETERQRVCWCVFCYFCWTENIGKKSIGSKVFLETYVFVEAPTNWLKCSDIVWIMSIDKSSFAFRCFSLTFCTYLPLSAWMYFVLIFFTSLFYSRFLIWHSFCCVYERRNSSSSSSSSPNSVYIYKLCTLRHRSCHWCGFDWIALRDWEKWSRIW